MDDIIARIKHKLAYLQAHDDGDVTDASRDREWQIKSHYPYSLQGPHTDKEIKTFEKKHHIRLPDDYREFLLKVGRSGVGPYNNFYSPISQMDTPDEIEAVKEQQHLSEDDFLKIENFPLWELALPFPFTEPTADMIDFLLDRDLEDADAHNGLIILSDGGGIWQGLVVTGECRGQMWYMENDDCAPIYITNPEERDSFELNEADRHAFSPTTRVTFTQWYEAWINEQISIAQEHWRKRGRSVPPLTLDDN